MPGPNNYSRGLLSQPMQPQGTGLLGGAPQNSAQQARQAIASLGVNEAVRQKALAAFDAILAATSDVGRAVAAANKVIPGTRNDFKLPEAQSSVRANSINGISPMAGEMLARGKFAR